ncbi:MAG: type IX secretion system membrane protein PorP/SprF [Adhaeribacter sp.]
MNKILRLGFSGLFCLLGWQAQAQQSAQYTQYAFNSLVINPAYAGSKGVLQFNGLLRSQWTGLEGAPQTQTLSLDGNALNKKMGLGLHLINDKIGAQGQKSAYLSTAVKVWLSSKAKLALGIAAGASQYYLDESQLTVNNPDPTLSNGRESRLLPDSKLGLYFNTPRFFAGLSAGNAIGFKNQFKLAPRRHFFLTSGYVFDLGEMLKFRPSFLLKDDFRSPANLDLNAFVLIGDRLWLGGTYRTAMPLLHNEAFDQYDLQSRNAWALLTEIYLTPQWKLGYSHDFTTTELSRFGTHELSLGLYFFRNTREARSVTIRYF